MKIQREESFGIIPLSRKNGNWEVFLIQHRGGRYWGFPKGHREPKETALEAASRELKEETNLDCVRLLREKPLEEEYSFHFDRKRILKKVLYFIAEVDGTVHLQKTEINDGTWLPFPEAIEQVTHPEGKAILTEVMRYLEKSL
ncbi:MAG: NUDIX domain-containing protein [Chlamydiae bacterium]|nr:NUDIX domain-containing protein [Chlamydiota bacterium]